MGPLDEHTQIRVARVISRRTQRAVAIQIGIAPAVLSEYELGYRNLPPAIIRRLRAALRLDTTGPRGGESARPEGSA